MSRVLPVTDGRVLLEDSLRPVLMFLRCNGLVTDFLTPNREHRALYIARCIFTGLIVSIVWSHFAFLSTQIVVTHLFEDDKVFLVSFTCMMALNGSTPVLTQYIFFVHGKKFQQFFESWKRVEMQSSGHCKGINPEKITRSLNMLKGFYLFILIGQPFSISYVHMISPNKPFFLSYYPFFCDRFNSYFLSFIHAMLWYYSFLYLLLGDILFTIFFYHAGCVIEDLISQVQHISEPFFSKSLIFRESGIFIESAVKCNVNDKYRKGRHFRRIWKRYETVTKWVNRANELFGALILWNQLVNFITLLISCYLSVKMLKMLPLLTLSTVTAAIVVSFKTVLINRFTSHLYLSRGKLQRVIAGLLSDEWYLLPHEDRQLLVSFQARLNNEDLAACPMNLFTINPTNLLTTLSLIVTYMVVIFQTDGVV